MLDEIEHCHLLVLKINNRVVKQDAMNRFVHPTAISTAEIFYDTEAGSPRTARLLATNDSEESVG